MPSPISSGLISRASIAPRSETSSWRPALPSPKQKRRTRPPAPEVEAPQPPGPRLVACRDPVEVVLHPGREVVVDKLAEVLLEQADDREGEERRNERRAALEDVAAIEDGAENRCVRRRAPDPELLQRPHECRLGVAGRRARLVPRRLEREEIYGVPLRQVREATLLVALLRRAVVVASLLVSREEAAERDHRPGGPELHRL